FEEVKTEGDQIINVASEIMVEEVFEVEILAIIDEDREWDVCVIEEEVPEFWMVEDESLRTRKFSKGAGMMRKWVLTPEDKKSQEPRRPYETRNRAKTTHSWPRRRVRARMRGEWTSAYRALSTRKRARALGTVGCAWAIGRIGAKRAGRATGSNTGVRDCTGIGVRGSGKHARNEASDSRVRAVEREWSADAGDVLNRVGIGVLDDECRAHGGTHETQGKNMAASLILVGIGKARILILAGIGKAVECRNTRGRSVTGVTLGRSGNVSRSIFLVGKGIVDTSSKHNLTRNRSGAAGARDLVIEGLGERGGAHARARQGARCLAPRGVGISRSARTRAA
ncbi:Unknown protein, partial [Striga hermonthica]